MKLSTTLEIVPGSSEAELDSGLTWLSKFVGAYEDKDTRIVSQFFADSPSTTFQIEGTHALRGHEALKMVFDWMFKATSKSEWTLTSITVTPAQVLFTLSGSILSTKAATPSPIVLTGVFDKNSEYTKATTLRLFGDTKKLLRVFKLGVNVPYPGGSYSEL